MSGRGKRVFGVQADAGDAGAYEHRVVGADLQIAANHAVVTGLEPRHVARVVVGQSRKVGQWIETDKLLADFVETRNRNHIAGKFRAHRTGAIRIRHGR